MSRRSPLLSLRGFALPAAAYAVVFGGLLLWTHGLPYAVDNNETFSSLWHARHLYQEGVGQTKGLADEVFAWHAAASPYVHTHQGNFPRLFAFLLYALGARSAESQIILTTFTVGLAAIWLAHRFLRTLGPPLFAAIGCLVLITDYGLLGQWQVDTYRVWYGFFFFGSLYWVSRLEGFPRWPMLAAGAALFAAMFYGEYVFAAFVAVTACGFALLSHARRPRQFLRAWLAVLLGGAAAAALLLSQLVAYMGWEGVRLDLGYTLAARNMAKDQAFTDRVDQFYRDHRVIFWQNYFDTANLRTLRAFGTSFVQKHLQYYGPWLCVAVILVLAGAWIGLCRRADHPASGLAQSRVRRGFRFALTWVLPGVILVSIGVGALRYLRPLFDGSAETLSRAALGLEPPTWIGWLAFLLAFAFGLFLAVRGTGRTVGAENRLHGLLSLSVCVAVGYAAAYRGFTGYVYSGYLNRQAPFLVFWTDLLLAGALYFVVEAVRRGFADACGDRPPVFLPIAGSALLVLFGGAWATLQLGYLAVVPPTGEPFLNLLSRAPYRGGTFVVNDYPAPVAEKTKAWAYAESSIFSGRVRLGPDGFSTEHDTKYLWFADAGANGAYMKPDYGLFIDQPASIAEALAASGNPGPQSEHPIAFETTGLIRRTQEALQPFIWHRLIASDGRRFSIVKFDWDFPPFLKPLDAEIRKAARSLSLQQKLAFSESTQEERRRWRLAIEPVESPRGAEGTPTRILLTEATIDGRPVFSSDALLSAGWEPNSASGDNGGEAWTGRPGISGRLEGVVVGDAVSLSLLEGPGRGAARVEVNDMTQVVDLDRPGLAEHVISFGTSSRHDKYTTIPSPVPGTRVNTWLTAENKGPLAVLRYRFAHQEGKAEEATMVRVYHEPSPGHWRLADTLAILGSERIAIRLDEFRRSNPDTLSEYARVQRLGDARTYAQWLSDHLEANPGERKREGILDLGPPPASSDSEYPAAQWAVVPLPAGLEGRIQLSVTPGTRTKSGPEYFGLSFDAARASTARQGALEAVHDTAPRTLSRGEFPYGSLRLRVRFPTNQFPQAEPIVSSGFEEAGDFVYVIYADAGHIRIGFDHWFKGGPLTAPIALDYSRVHELEISMGSLFPPEEDVVFMGMSAAAVAELKGNVWVSLDGRTVLQAPSEFWDSPPAQVTVGRNDIKGTTSNPRFNGEVLECKRVWPDLH